LIDTQSCGTIPSGIVRIVIVGQSRGATEKGHSNAVPL